MKGLNACPGWVRINLGITCIIGAGLAGPSNRVLRLILGVVGVGIIIPTQTGDYH